MSRLVVPFAGLIVLVLVGCSRTPEVVDEELAVPIEVIRLLRAECEKEELRPGVPLNLRMISETRPAFFLAEVAARFNEDQDVIDEGRVFDRRFKSGFTPSRVDFPPEILPEEVIEHSNWRQQIDGRKNQCWIVFSPLLLNPYVPRSQMRGVFVQYQFYDTIFTTPRHRWLSIPLESTREGDQVSLVLLGDISMPLPGPVMP